MKVVAAQRVKRAGTGEWWLAVIMHDAELDVFQLTGADVEGMNDDDLIAAGSIVCTPTANYISFEDGIFTKSEIAGSGGGGGGGTAGVSTFNGRSGNVMPRSGDYDAAKIRTTTAGKSVQDILDNLEALATLDTALSTSSEKAVQNKVITEAINELRAMVLPVGGSAGDILTKVDSTNFNTEWVSQNVFMKKSEYDTDNNGRVDKADVAYALQGPTYKAELKNTSSNTYVVTEDEKGKRNGVVPLDSNRKILPEYLPDSITSGLTYGGIFNAQTRVVRLTEAAKSILGISADTMTLEDSPQVPAGYPANVELFYVTTVADTFASMDFAVGDWLISLGTSWQQLKNGSQVSSVNGATGAVQLNSDDISQGVSNLYMTPQERSKLADIEPQATKDTNVIQNAQIVTLPSGNRVLRLTNKNGTVTDFEGSGANLDDYLKKNGNASTTYVVYNTGGNRQTFTGNEALQLFFQKVVAWLNALETVAFSGSYLDLSDKPTRTSQFVNDGNGTDPYITRTTNTLANYYLKSQTYTKTEVDNLLDAIESFTFIQVNTLPTDNINDKAIYYVPKTGGGYTRYQHMSGEWLNLGDTDMSMAGYLHEDGNSSNTTVDFVQAENRGLPTTGDTLSEVIGQLVKDIDDLKTICFTASWHDLEDGNELATKEDLEDYLPIHSTTTDEGKVPVVNADGDLELQVFSSGVMRRGDGVMSMIGNDEEANPINTASGQRATAIGNHTQASGEDQFVDGRYNVPDNVNAYSEITGGGAEGAPENIKTFDWSGNLWTKGKVSVGNTTNNIVPITQGNDLTTKNYVDNYVEESIASANLLKSMVVQEIPDVEDADDNILYLIADPLAEDTYLQFKKVLESQNPDVYVMAQLGSTHMSTNSTQVTELPTPSLAYKDAVYQYVGTASNYDFGMFYACKNTPYYAWLSTSDAKNYYTLSATPTQYAKMFDENFNQISATVKTFSGNTLTDSANKTYTRLTASDTSKFEWHILNEKLSEYQNDGNGTGAPNDYFVTRANALSQGTDISSVSDTTKISKVTPATGQVLDVTAKKLFDYMWKKIYPVGSIYISATNDNPGTLFGGTWSLIGSDRVLWGVSAATTPGSTLDEQIPDIRGHIDWATGGQAKTEISSGTGAFNLTNKNLGAAYPTGAGASNSARGFDFRASYYSSVYKLNASVRPNAYTVHFWRRTA